MTATIKNRLRVYRDADGNELSLYQMVRREPEWAANRIRVGEISADEVERLERENAQLKADLAKARRDGMHMLILKEKP